MSSFRGFLHTLISQKKCYNLIEQSFEYESGENFMATVNFRTGADAIFIALSRICIVINRYSAKLQLAIDAALAAGLITDTQRATANAFILSARAVCDIFRIVARNSGPG
jgi:hypothetical protein